MTMSLASSLVRIYTASGEAVGAGFLIGDGLILTCAHVVAAALEIPEDVQEASGDEVLLDFPLVELKRRLTARDVAGLELMDALPDDAQPVLLVTADDLLGHHSRAFGFPAGYDSGVWTSGRLLGREATGWVQVEDIKVTGHRVRPGFSGTPVWNEQLDSVVEGPSPPAPTASPRPPLRSRPGR